MWLAEDRAKFTAEEQARIDYPGPRGIGENATQLSMSYESVQFVTPIVRGDAVVREHVFMASIDIHGHEYGALRGLEGTIARHGIDVLIVETIGTNKDAGLAALRLLASHGYVLFDFIPIRFCMFPMKLKRPCAGIGRQEKLFNFTPGPTQMSAQWYATERRPAGPVAVHAWYHWFRTEAGPGVNTDVLAVHQSYLKPAHLSGLLQLAKAAQAGRETHGARPRLQLAEATAELHKLKAQCEA